MEKPTRAATGRDSDKYIVRFPDGMRDAIADAAKQNNRSMNAEIVDRLSASFSPTANSEAFAFLMSRMEMRAADAELDVSQLKLMLAEICWGLRQAILYLDPSLNKNEEVLSEQIKDWNDSIDAAKRYIGHDLDDINGITNELREKLSSFDNASEKSKNLFIKTKNAKLPS